MAKNRVVNTLFWDDSYISGLSIEERYLFLYFLTSPHSNIAGVYQVSMKYLLIDTGMKEESILRICKKFEKDNRIIYRDNWVAIKNFMKHQKIGGGTKFEKGMTEFITIAPKWAQDYVMIGYRYRITSQSQFQSQSQLQYKSKFQDTSEDVGQPSAVEDSEPQVQDGKSENKEVTEMLAWIQEELSLTDFKEDSRKQRLRGLHISGLRSNLGEKEFLRRWKTLIGDAFKKERCSSLDYIYSEMKAGFDASADKAKKKKKRESAEESEKKAEEAKRQADAAERKKLEELMESLTPEEINDIENEAKESLIKVGITLYSETKKGRPEAFQKMLKGSILSIIKRKYASNL